MKIECLRNVTVGLGLVSALLLSQSAHAQPPKTPPPKPTEAAKPTEPAAPPAGESKNVTEAKARYKAGLTLYDDGAYDAARVQFERAYELAPSYKILYNVGLVYKQLNEFVGALKSLEQYLTEGGKEIPDDRRADVTKLIASLKQVVASVEVTTNVPGAEITVDDAVVGKSPMNGRIPLNPGRRKIGAKLAGKLPDAKVITVASGDNATVELLLNESVVINQGTDVKPIIAWAVTGGLAIGAGVTAFLANGASNDREDLLVKRDVTRKDLDDATDKQKTLSLVSDILSVSTIVAAGVAVYFTWIHKSPEKKAPTRPEPDKTSPSALRITPGVGSLLVQF